MALAGCGNSATNGQNDNKATLPTTTGPTAPPSGQAMNAPPAGSRPVDKAQIESQLPKGAPAEAWTTGDNSSLVVTGKEGGCSKASAETTEQTAQHVTVKLIESVPKDAKICTMDLRYPKLAVAIAEPLGARKVVLIYEKRQV